MKAVRKFSSILAVSVTLFCLISAALYLIKGKGSHAQTQATNFANLKLHISTSKQRFIESEPIPFILKLENGTSNQITGHTAFDFTSRRTYLRIRREGGSEKEFNDFSPVAKAVGIRPRQINPGERHETKELLNYNLGEMFPYAGQYQVQAILLNTNGVEKAYSNTISIEIAAPVGLNLSALNFIKTNSNSKMFLSGGRFNDDRAVADMENFVENFGNTVYADYVTFNLGEFYLVKKDYIKAAIYLRRLNGRENFHYAQKVKKYLAILVRVQTTTNS